VYFVEGHNFHVEWHYWFEVQIGEKCKSTLEATIHRRPENSKLGIRFVHNWLRKRPYALCESCRGSGDLQLCFSLLGPLLFNFLEIFSVKQGCLKKFRRHWRSGTRRPRRCRASPAPWSLWSRTPRLGYHVESPAQRFTSPAGPAHRRTAFPSLSPRATRRARTGRTAPTLAAGLWRRCRTLAQRHHLAVPIPWTVVTPSPRHECL
jgi:hypothetical protein